MATAVRQQSDGGEKDPRYFDARTKRPDMASGRRIYRKACGKGKRYKWNAPENKKGGESRGGVGREKGTRRFSVVFGVTNGGNDREDTSDNRSSGGERDREAG